MGICCFLLEQLPKCKSYQEDQAVARYSEIIKFFKSLHHVIIFMPVNILLVLKSSLFLSSFACFSGYVFTEDDAKEIILSKNHMYSYFLILLIYFSFNFTFLFKF